MCDWEAEEYAEYLLWIEAETARSRVRYRAPADKVSQELVDEAEAPAVSMVA
jgi:hypothetical protein